MLLLKSSPPGSYAWWIAEVIQSLGLRLLPHVLRSVSHSRLLILRLSAPSMLRGNGEREGRKLLSLVLSQGPCACGGFVIGQRRTGGSCLVLVQGGCQCYAWLRAGKATPE